MSTWYQYSRKGPAREHRASAYSAYILPPNPPTHQIMDLGVYETNLQVVRSEKSWEKRGLRHSVAGRPLALQAVDPDSIPFIPYGPSSPPKVIP